MFVILEGFDKTGKTSLMKYMGKINSWREVYIDRGPAGYLFYDELLKRATVERTENYQRDAIQLRQLDCIVVFLKSNAHDIKDRHELHNEYCIIPLDEDIEKEQDNYLDICGRCYEGIPMIMLNTSTLSIQTCAEEIDKFAKLAHQSYASRMLNV